MANLHIKGSTEIDDTGVTLDNLRNNKLFYELEKCQTYKKGEKRVT